MDDKITLAEIRKVRPLLAKQLEAGIRTKEIPAERIRHLSGRPYVLPRDLVAQLDPEFPWLDLSTTLPSDPTDRHTQIITHLIEALRLSLVG